MTVLRGLEGREGLERLDGPHHPASPACPAYPASLYLRRGADDAGQGPAFPAARRPRLGDRDDVANLCGVLFVGDHELRCAPLGLAVEPAAHLPLDGDDDALLHLVADDDADFF